MYFLHSLHIVCAHGGLCMYNMGIIPYAYSFVIGKMELMLCTVSSILFLKIVSNLINVARKVQKLLNLLHPASPINICSHTHFFFSFSHQVCGCAYVHMHAHYHYSFYESFESKLHIQCPILLKDSSVHFAQTLTLFIMSKYSHP